MQANLPLYFSLYNPNPKSIEAVAIKLLHINNIRLSKETDVRQVAL